MDNDDFLFSSTVVALLKGVVNNTGKDKLWTTIKEKRWAIEEYVSKIGLALVVHEDDGYAYLKQRNDEDEEKILPRLMQKRQVDFRTSLVLVLLRKEMIELNKLGNSERFIITQTSFYETIIPYLKETTDEVKQKKEIDLVLKKVQEMGFIKILNNKDNDIEIFQLVRGFVTAQLVEDVDVKLKEYLKYNSADEEETGGDE